MPNLFTGLRWKLVWLFFLSVGLSLTTLLVLVLLVESLYRIDLLPLRPFFRWLFYDIGLIQVLSAAGLFLFVLYVVLISWRSIKYLEQITNGVKQLSNGKFDRHIPVKTKDELGGLADNINKMARQLNTSMEEERLAVKSKNELITHVSHDLRTPLTSIIGYLRLIEEDRYKDEVELRYYVDIAYRKSQRLGRMVNDLFEYSRLSYSQVNLERTQINLIELLGQLTAEFSLQLREAEMDIRLSVVEDKIMISADGDKLMRAFENLIANAINYGQAGKKVDIVVQKEPDMVIVRVINYGLPIPLSDLPRIFERLYRVEKSRSDETGGTGLGLAIVKSIIELHNGTITVYSDEKETAFEIKLPG